MGCTNNFSCIVFSNDFVHFHPIYCLSYNLSSTFNFQTAIYNFDYTLFGNILLWEFTYVGFLKSDEYIPYKHFILAKCSCTVQQVLKTYPLGDALSETIESGCHMCFLIKAVITYNQQLSDIIFDSPNYTKSDYYDYNIDKTEEIDPI